MAILTAVFCTQTATAKLGVDRTTIQLESKIEVNVEAEIVDNINKMLSNVQVPNIKTDVAKQLDIGTIQLQTNELVQNVGEKLPEFKFKVIIAE